MPKNKMPEKLYFLLLILCGIWSQGITGTFADENINESSEFHTRQKRVISYLPGEDTTTHIRNVPYIVAIRHNNRISCVGSILSHHVVITIPACVRFAASEYQVLSGTSRADHGNPHNVLHIMTHFSNNPSRPSDGIALLAVNPPFVFGVYTFNIELHSGPLLQGTNGLIGGWGYNTRVVGHGTTIPGYLRTIAVTIISHQDCVNRYPPHINITDKEVCTYHPQRHTGHNDGGAPLVVDGELAGVHLWTGPDRTQNDPRYPDVFAVLQHLEYNQWIRTNVRDIEAYFQNHHMK